MEPPEAGAGVRLVYETHATTTDNEAGIATGWLPGRLSPAGRGQARQLGARHAHGVDAVFAFLAELAGDWPGRRVVVIAHRANQWALDHLLLGTPLEELVAAPFRWQPGWTYLVPPGWGRDGA